MSVRSLSNQRVTLKKIGARTADVYGTWTETSDVRYTDMPCQIQPMSGKQQALYDSERTPVTHIMFVPDPDVYTGIVETDTVILGSRRFEIELVRNIDIRNHHYEIELREIKEAL